MKINRSQLPDADVLLDSLIDAQLELVYQMSSTISSGGSPGVDLSERYNEYQQVIDELSDASRDAFWRGPGGGE